MTKQTRRKFIAEFKVKIALEAFLLYRNRSLLLKTI